MLLCCLYSAGIACLYERRQSNALAFSMSKTILTFLSWMIFLTCTRNIVIEKWIEAGKECWLLFIISC